MTAYQPASLRLALGLGDQELEQRLRPALEAAPDLTVVAQCLAADQLLQVVQSRAADAVLVAWSLHRLSDAMLDQIDRAGPVVVLLVPDPSDERWRQRRGAVLALDSDANVVRQALAAAARGERVLSRPRPSPEPVRLKTEDRESSSGARILAVTGGAGSPGRTTVALNLAVALGTLAPTVLVEADLSAPALAAYLDLDPSRNLCTLAHAVHDDPHVWASALSDELQPLSPLCPHGVALCGVPKREMRISVAPAFVERLLSELARRHRYVIVDVGAELLGVEAAALAHRAAIAAATQVVVVASSDLVGLWHARTALDQLEHQLGLARDGLQLVLNRHDARFHHASAEVEWHLGARVASAVPHDHSAAQRAVAEQVPLVANGTSRAARALVALAGRIHEGQVRFPSATGQAASRTMSWWRRVLPSRRTRTVQRRMLGAKPVAPELGVRTW